MSNPGAVLASTVTAAAALGFVPVAVHFHLFDLLNQIGYSATADALTEAYNKKTCNERTLSSPLCVRLTADTMYAMAGLGFVDLIDEDTFRSNAITKHIGEVPSAIHGMLHFTTEPLWAAAFLMRQLKDTNFRYPFEENHTPTQFGYKLIGEERFVNQHTYSIMQMQGRMPSFNMFMEGKFGKFGAMPARVKGFGYDLTSVLTKGEDEVIIIDIGGGRGEVLLELQDAFPHLGRQNLILQEYEPDEVNADRLTVQHWDFKGSSPQPVPGASMYSLTHIYHNMPDLDALVLMKKIAAAMTPRSRMLIHEFSKNATYGKMHATMIELYAGRIRSSREWKQMAALSGLEVTFEAYPVAGEGLVEMRKLAS